MTEYGAGVDLWSGLLGLAFVALLVWLFARIARKAGFSGWWSLLMLVPVVNVVLVWVFAFVQWPAETRPERHAEVFD